MNGDIRMRKNKGYTLIEILLVLALLSILLSMAVPNLSLYKKMKENMELERLKKDLLFTRNSAILEGIDYFVDFDYSTNSYSIRDSKYGKITKKIYFVNGIKLNNRAKVVTFHFKRSGTIGSSDTVMLKNSKGKSLQLTLTPTTGSINIKQ